VRFLGNFGGFEPVAEHGGWDVVRAGVREQIGPRAYDAWFRTLDGEVRGERVVVRCPDRFSRDWIRERYGEVLERVAPRGAAIEYEIAAARGPAPVSALIPGAVAQLPTPEARPAAPEGFESFVAGAGNALALEAARAMARGQAGRCSPLFLHGVSGLGKTHLCRAIRSALGSAAVYRSSEEFTSEVTQAIRSGEMQRVRQRYRRAANVLILEDVQFLSGKQATQVELFHTLDHLLEAGRPVVLSADRSPAELDGIDPKLRSRMASGLVACIEPPDLETRRAILRDRAARGGVRLPEECLEQLVVRPVSSVRDLVSGLNQVIARASLLGQPIGPELVAQAIAAVDVPGGPRTIEQVMRAVARAYGVELDDLRSRSRRRSLVRPRQLAMYICRRSTDVSLKDIGRAFNRDHTSVMYAIGVVEQRVAQRPQLRYELEALARKL
jgi:chromosomal replication initiator protein